MLIFIPLVQGHRLGADPVRGPGLFQRSYLHGLEAEEDEGGVQAGKCGKFR